MKPPKHLSPSSKRFWEWVSQTYSIDEGDFKILQTACESMDSAEKARQVLEAEGQFYQDSRGIVRCHPATRVLRESQLLALRSLKALGLEPARGNNYGIAHSRY